MGNRVNERDGTRTIYVVLRTRDDGFYCYMFCNMFVSFLLGFLR